MEKLQVLQALLDRLWEQYRHRVSYAQDYTNLVKEKGSSVYNDHIALRTFNTATGDQPAGVEAISRVIEPLAYVRKDQYIFNAKKLTAWHWEHENDDFPKIFASQLEVDQLSDETALLINQSVENTRGSITESDLNVLQGLAKGEDLDSTEAATLVENLSTFFNRQWSAPKREDVEKVNEASQYAAWTLLHGNSVNHFTAYINKQNVAEWPDLQATVGGLKEAGIPMKDGIEGEIGSKLVQSSTKAVMEECEVIEDDGSIGQLEWTYAYYELAERGQLNGKLFQGFLGDQATNLFEMTSTDN